MLKVRQDEEGGRNRSLQMSLEDFLSKQKREFRAYILLTLSGSAGFL